MIGQVQCFLEENPERRTRIAGFTDSTGSDEVNRDRPRRRAEAVPRALESGGVEASRIQAAGLGEAYPVPGNGSAEVAGR